MSAPHPDSLRSHPSGFQALESPVEMLASRTAAAIEAGAQVLYLESAPSVQLLDRLKARNCRVTTVRYSDDPRVPQQFAGQRFDVAIVSDVLTSADDPIRLVKSLAPLLTESGHVVAAVPNLAHPAIRHEPSGGQSRRFYTRELLDTFFEACGFVVGQIDRVEWPMPGGDSVPGSRARLDDVLTALANDWDATCTHFVATAIPVPASPLAVFKDKVRGLVRRCEIVEQTLRRLPVPSASETELAVARRQVAALGEHSAQLHLVIDQLREQLRQSESAPRAQPIDHTVRDLQDRLRANHEQVQLIRESFSWRLTAPLRAVARAFGRTTTDATLRLKE